MSQNELILDYQTTGNAAALLESYENFLQKYYKLFSKKEVDFTNYDIRRFIACFIYDNHIVHNLCENGDRTQETVDKAYEVMNNIIRVFKGYSNMEIYNEIVVIFLECATEYKEIGSGFRRYIYNVFRYRMKKWIDSKMNDASGYNDNTYRDNLYSEDYRSIDEILDQKYYDNPMNMEYDENEDLDNLLWLNGIVCSPLFKKLTYSERYIMVMAYEKGMDDKEIAKINGFHHRSVYRVKRRMVKYFREERSKGNIKCIR